MNLMNAKSKRGFTLIELLVVIAIIGMLSSIVLGSLNTARTKARDAARQETLKSVQTAVELYYLVHGNYPVGTAFSVWDTYGWNGGVGWGQAFFSVLVTEKYISTLSRDPVNVEGGTGNFLGDNSPTDLSYRYSSDGQGYILGTNLESGSLTANNCGNWQIRGGSATYACP